MKYYPKLRNFAIIILKLCFFFTHKTGTGIVDLTLNYLFSAYTLINNKKFRIRL